MSFQNVGLGKFLRALYAPPPQRRRLLRDDARSTLVRAGFGTNPSGGDFHGPFWADAKAHVAGLTDLRLETFTRIGRSSGRSRLYPQLQTGFLGWWEPLRRSFNPPVRMISEHILGGVDLGGGRIKVENTLAFIIPARERQIVYGYFAEIPDLSLEAARIGLWIMSKALAGYNLEEMRLLDVLRSNCYSSSTLPLMGNEENLATAGYRQLLREWEIHREEIQRGLAA